MGAALKLYQGPYKIEFSSNPALRVIWVLYIAQSLVLDVVGPWQQ